MAQTTVIFSRSDASTLLNATRFNDDFSPGNKLNDFDFTLLFEQSILSLAPSALFLLLAAVRIFQLRRETVKTLPARVQSFKTITAAAYAVLQLALLILWRTNAGFRNDMSVSAAAVSFVASVAILLLSYIEHKRSIRPSSILTVYLLMITLFDAAQVRTLFLLRQSYAIPALMSAALAVGALLLVLESQSKRGYLRQPYRSYSTEATSGIISWSLLWWLNVLFQSGWRRILTYEDVHSIDDVLTGEPLGRRMNKAWSQRSRPESSLTIPLVIFSCFRIEIIAAAVPRIVMIGFYYAQPFLITRSINFLEEAETVNSTNIGYGLIGATFLIYVGIALTTVHYQQRIGRLETMIRGAMIRLIFDHTLRLRDGSSSEASALTLMSADVDTIIVRVQMVYNIWATSIEIALGIYLLARQIGYMCVIPIVIIALGVGLQSIVSWHIGGSVKNANDATQKRTGFIATTLDGMKSIRMTGLSITVKRLITSLRTTEIALLTKFRTWIIWQNVIANIANPWSSVITLAAYEVRAQVQSTPSLSVVQAFTALSIIYLLSEPAAEFLSSLPSLASAMGSCKRVQEYLLLETFEDQRQTPSGIEPVNASTHYISEASTSVELTSIRPKSSGNHTGTFAVALEELSLRYPGASHTAVSEVSLTIEVGSVAMILGPVGSGKSTLLKAIHGEVVPNAGTIKVSTPEVGYCGQLPWLPNESIQQIVCGKNREGAIDEAWYKTVIYGCALDSDIASLPQGDMSIIGSQGLTLSGGQKQRLALARAVYARQRILLLDDVLSALDAKTEQIVVERLLSKTSGLLRRMFVTVVVVTHSVRHLNAADKLLLLSAEGKLIAQGSYDFLASTSTTFTNMLATLRTLDTTSEPMEVLAGTGDKPKELKSPTLEQQQDLTRRTGDFSVYKYYVNAVGWTTLTGLGASCAVNAFALTFPQVWLEWWTSSPTNQLGLRIGIYIMLAVVATLSHYAYLWFSLIAVMTAGAKRLHKILLDTVFNAPQSFFVETDSGVTLNRFSQDISVTDRQMIGGLIVTLTAFFGGLAIIGLISTGSSYMAASIPVLFIALYMIQNIYLKTSRQLRLLDLEAKSPLYSHFVETLAGLTTIRAFGWQRHEVLRNQALLDHSQRPYYYLNCVQRWLSMVLNLLVAGMAVVLIALAVNLRGRTSGGYLGVALNNILTFNANLSSFLLGWTTLETSLGAIARIKNFEKLTPNENQARELVVPPPDWPSSGAIQFHNVSASYDPAGAQLALRDINLSITPGQKIGMCGRTGSGKSTLLLTLLRLVEMTEDSGSITIDGIDISTIPRDELRARFVAIPQDPFMLSGSIRTNADPTGLYTDNEILATLAKVDLSGAVQARGGLDANLQDQPLSRGQQQLFCLARAMLRKKSRVLVLDEATSNVDAETDALMQRVIREEFREYTIIVVAHRLDTILDADKIIVMDDGRVVEFDTPQNLLRVESMFRQLYGSKEVQGAT